MEVSDEATVNCQRCGAENTAKRAACFNCGTLLLTDSGAAEASEEHFLPPPRAEQAETWQIVLGIVGVALLIYLLWQFVIAPSMGSSS